MSNFAEMRIRDLDRRLALAREAKDPGVRAMLIAQAYAAPPSPISVVEFYEINAARSAVMSALIECRNRMRARAETAQALAVRMRRAFSIFRLPI